MYLAPAWTLKEPWLGRGRRLPKDYAASMTAPPHGFSSPISACSRAVSLGYEIR
jgi:hypothetical protein